jgi:hypothetical protein
MSHRKFFIHHYHRGSPRCGALWIKKRVWRSIQSTKGFLGASPPFCHPLLPFWGAGSGWIDIYLPEVNIKNSSFLLFFTTKKLCKIGLKLGAKGGGTTTKAWLGIRVSHPPLPSSSLPNKYTQFKILSCFVNPISRQVLELHPKSQIAIPKPLPHLEIPLASFGKSQCSGVSLLQKGIPYTLILVFIYYWTWLLT